MREIADSIREVRVTLAGCEDTTVSGQERHVGRNIAPTSEGERAELEFTVESSPDHETATCSVRIVLVGEGTPGDIEVGHRIRVEGVVISSDDGSTSDTQIIGSPPVIEDQLPAPFMTALVGIGLCHLASESVRDIGYQPTVLTVRSDQETVTYFSGSTMAEPSAVRRMRCVR